jgi:hypothetical protein
MKNIFSELTKQFSRMTKSTASALVGKELDWNRIDAARERLVRMRFETLTAGDSHMSNGQRPNEEISGKRKLANLRQKDSVGLSRWFADRRQINSDALSKQIHESVYRTKASNDPWCDGDWRIVKRQYNSHVLSSMEYEQGQYKTEQPLTTGLSRWFAHKGQTNGDAMSKQIHESVYRTQASNDPSSNGDWRIALSSLKDETECEQERQYDTQELPVIGQSGDQQSFDPNVVYTQQSQITAPQSHIAALMEILEINAATESTQTPIALTPLASLLDANREQSFDPESCQHEVQIPVVPTPLANLLDPYRDPHPDQALDLAS